jgi:hypothetical protein
MTFNLASGVVPKVSFSCFLYMDSPGTSSKPRSSWDRTITEEGGGAERVVKVL